MVLQHQLRGLYTPAFLSCLLNACAIPSGKVADCDIQKGSCTKPAGLGTITIDIEPKPVRAMKELSFSIKVQPNTSLPDTLMLDLGMPDMQMGKNQIALTKKSDCTFQGKGIIVKCRSGHKLWQATLLSDPLKNPSFTFNVRE
jgi:hypothetical protein